MKDTKISSTTTQEPIDETETLASEQLESVAGAGASMPTCPKCGQSDSVKTVMVGHGILKHRCMRCKHTF